MTFSQENAQFHYEELLDGVHQMYEALKNSDVKEVGRCARLLRVQIKDLENTLKEDEI